MEYGTWEANDGTMISINKELPVGLSLDDLVL